jgi:hypothetical protein
LRVVPESRNVLYVLSIRGNERFMMGDFCRHTPRISPLVYLRFNGGACPLARDRRDHVFTTGCDFVCATCKGILESLAFDPPLNSRSTDMAFYLSFGPHTMELEDFAAIVGLRWTIEEGFQSAKGETGPDRCEACSRHGWHRTYRYTLSVLTLAFLAILLARLKEAQIISFA